MALAPKFHPELCKLGRNAPPDDKMVMAWPLRGRFEAQQPPRSLVRRDLPFEPQLWGNDRVGNCTAVALGNLARGMAAINGFAISVSEAQVMDLYSRFGYNPAMAGTDRGAVMIDVLESQEVQGWDVGLQVPLVGSWGSFEPTDRFKMANVMAELGGAYVGLALAVSDQHGGLWDIGGEDPSWGDTRPGSWGGHAVHVWDYNGLADSDLVRISTWGQFQFATWRWLASRAEEAHGVLWGDLGVGDWDKYQSLRAEFGLD